jgi:hypothetical protein
MSDEKERLQAVFDEEAPAFQKAKKILDDLYAAQAKREAAEENARRQKELEEEQAEATRKLLEGFFVKKSL